MSDSTLTPVDNITIGAMLRNTAQKFPSHDAVVFPSLTAESELRPADDKEQNPRNCLRWNYQELDERVDQVAKSLIALGVKKGEHVAVWATNWPQWVLLQYGSARIGVVQVNINPAYKSHELSYVLKQSDSVAFFLIDQFKESNYFSIASDIIKELKTSSNSSLKSEEFPKLRHVVSMKKQTVDGIMSWDDFIELGNHISDEELAKRESELTADEPINIQYTSGTTGFPKGAMLAHSNILTNAYYVGDCQDFTEKDRICLPLPFYHCFGCVLGVLAAGIYGGAIVIPAEYYDAAAALAAIESEKATSIYGVPTMFIGQLEDPTFSKRDLTSLRTGIMSGSPCPIEVMTRVVNDMHVNEVTIAYGMTEASPVITQTRTDVPIELRVSTVGKPLPEIEVKLVNPETGETLGDNEQGELCTRGHVVMLGYYNMPEATENAIDSEGWLHSGDLAIRTADGFYKITGRMKDMICRGGENIYPREIEDLLHQHPAVQDVAVVGVPDPKYIEEIACWIKSNDSAAATEDEIREFCKSSLAYFKVPKYIRFVDEFPQTVTGKIRKFKIREIMIEELGLEESETA